MSKKELEMSKKAAIWSKSTRNGQKSTQNGQNANQSQMQESANKYHMINGVIFIHIFILFLIKLT